MRDETIQFEEKQIDHLRLPPATDTKVNISIEDSQVDAEGGGGLCCYGLCQVQLYIDELFGGRKDDTICA